MITRTIIGVWFTGCLSGIVGGVNVEQLHKTVGRHIGIVGTYRAESTFRAKTNKIASRSEQILRHQQCRLCRYRPSFWRKILAMFSTRNH
jgi:hypothetical protein